MDGVTVTFAVCGLLLGLIHLAIVYTTTASLDMILCSLRSAPGGVLNAVLCLGRTDSKD